MKGKEETFVGYEKKLLVNHDDTGGTRSTGETGK